MIVMLCEMAFALNGTASLAVREIAFFRYIQNVSKKCCESKAKTDGNEFFSVYFPVIIGLHGQAFCAAFVEKAHTRVTSLQNFALSAVSDSASKPPASLARDHGYHPRAVCIKNERKARRREGDK